ncbi:MAG TPA: helix-turn-helix transcriptional regulator [Pirellulales bacterium]|jgi:DNA-binding XRE family transcriptional regulator|nr:helix-turn-helix transcriptional regulator [Pirellulales bacterium]HEV3021796.1 helix-turn-helix transcriptional regulator [Pirellulales bacterium]
MSIQTLHLGDKAYVVLAREEFDRLTTLAKAAELPALPEPDADGNYPAVEYARATIARGIIRDRVATGMSQRDLARRAGIAVETLCRIETGKHTPSLPTMEKIDRALHGKRAAVAKPRGRRNRKKDP